MCLVVEPGDGFAVSMVANDAMEDADGAGTGVLDGFSHLVEGDFLVADCAQDDGRTPSNRWHQVDAVPIDKGLRRIDEVTIDRKPHTLDEDPQ